MSCHVAFQMTWDAPRPNVSGNNTVYHGAAAITTPLTWDVTMIVMRSRAIRAPHIPTSNPNSRAIQNNHYH